MGEKKKMKGGTFDVILIIGFFIGLFIVGLLISAIIVIIIYFLFKNQVDYPKKDKKSGTDKKFTWIHWLLLGLVVLAIIFIFILSI